MKKIKLLTIGLTTTAAIGLVPLALTSCNKGDQSEDLKIDDTNVQKATYGSVTDVLAQQHIATYSGFVFPSDVSIEDLTVTATDISGFDGTINCNIQSRETGYDVVVNLETTSYLLLSHPKFNLSFVDKKNPKRQFISFGYDIEFTTNTLVIEAKYETTQKVVTSSTSPSFILDGEFQAKWNGIVEVKDVSNIYIDVDPVNGVEVTADVIQFDTDGRFAVRFNFANVASEFTQTLSFSFKNKLLPGWSYSTFVNLTITKDTTQNFEYELSGDQATLTKCHNQDDTFYIPDELVISSSVYKVTAIKADVFKYKTNLKSVEIPQYVDDLDLSNHPFMYTSLSRITVDPNNQTYSSKYNKAYECNALFTTDGTIQTLQVGSAGTVLPQGAQLKVAAYAFAYNFAVTEVNFNQSMTSVGDHTFIGCINLKKVTLSGLMERISDSMFKACFSLTDVELNGESNIGYIDKYAFQGCWSLPAIYIPKSIKSISSTAFEGCRSLTQISVDWRNTKYTSQVNSIEINAIVDSPNQSLIVGCSGTIFPTTSAVTQIGDNAFNGRDNLTVALIPSNINIIGESAFANCPNLGIVTLPSTLAILDKGAFEGCSSLTEIEVPNVTTISSSTFKDCNSLTKVKLSDNVTEIKGLAFENCWSLQSINLPEKLTSIDFGAFRKCISLTDISLANVKTISMQAFKACISLTSVDLSNATSIGEEAFAQCAYLKTVTLSSSLTTITKSMFEACLALETIDIPASVTALSEASFRGCLALKEINFKGTSITSIPKYCFELCTSLTKIDLTNVTLVYEYAFNNCWSLSDLVSIDNITSIYDYAFESCVSLKTIMVGTNFGYIAKCAFVNCSGLQSVDLRKTVKLEKIPEKAFMGCSSLKTVQMSTSVVTIDINAFEDCVALETIDLESATGLTTINTYAFYNCKSLLKVTIPATVKEIGMSSFAVCTSLNSVTITNGVETIGSAAFYQCSALKTITIPTSITQIGAQAFAASGLTTAIFNVTNGWTYEDGTAVEQHTLLTPADAAKLLVEGKLIKHDA